ncbi:CAP domain-containing protein [Leptolyngbya ohadii]|uniref:CAP domain-containing protein n=1 Tax=Leptolyngbya ohadii TaxID=1962290 RepID=UPI000B5A1852|nr:CAP domain-containing protein [Leptolyngbya ohadii]
MMNTMSRFAASRKVQPLRSGGAATELGGLSTEKSPLRQSLAGRMRRSASTNLAAIERSVFQRINQYRQQRGLAALTTNSSITRQARQHSRNMANLEVLSHDGFSGRVDMIRKAVPLRGASENVAFNQGFSDPAAQAVNGWLNSPGHLQNIMGNYNLTGIGVARNNKGAVYLTQIFITR